MRVRKQLVCAAVLLHLLARRLPGARGQPVAELPLLSIPAVPVSTDVGMVFNDGQLQSSWSSWSWGLSYFNQRDVSAPAPGSSSSLCVLIQPFGALSLRTTQPFAAGPSMIEMHVRGNVSAAVSAAEQQKAMGSLEVQLESGQNAGEYRVSKSITVHDLLVQQAAEDGSNAQAQLAAMASGQWVTLRLRLSDLADGASASYDRITLGSCLQDMDDCTAALPNVGVCLDHIVLVSGVA